MNIKSEIAKLIDYKIDEVNYENLILESISEDKGDFCLPCFSFAKTMHKSPMVIAEEIKNSVNIGGLVEKCEVVAGYVNFFLNKDYVSKKIIEEITTNEDCFKLNNGKGKTICCEYSSVNLAKYMHIGHLKTTIIGESLARICEQLGCKVIRINYIGDYGTPFGKIIVGLEKWGNWLDVEKRGVDALQEYYVKFNQEAENDKSLDDEAREIFKLIELKDKKYYPIYKKIIDISIKEAERLLNILGVHFDSWKGESSYSDSLDGVVEMLDEKGLTKISEGAKIVDLTDFDMAPCLIRRSDGASLYATRDIAAAIDRFKNFHFDKMFYVVAVQQALHFKQFFKVLELAGFDFAKNLEHVSYGMLSLPTGKIASRKGKQATLVDLIDYSMKKARDVIKDRKFEIEDPENVAWKVTRAALNFSALKVETNKDCVFDIDKAFSFEGETAPYMQYTYTRIESIFRKLPELNMEVVDYSAINSTEAFNLIKECNNTTQVIWSAFEKREPSLIVKHTMDICKELNKFYATTKVLSGTDAEIVAKFKLLKTVQTTLKTLFNLICIDTLKEM